jgi:opacity protein-like surface antigen
MKGRTILVSLCAVLGLLSSPARAQEGWSFELTPYLWGAAMDGSVGAGQLPTVDIDMSFSDILDNLAAGLMGMFEARKGRWGLLFDGMYMKLEDSGTATRTGPGPVGATASASATLEIRQTTYAAAVAYRAIQGRAPLDVVGGLRYLKIEADARIDASLFGQTGTRDLGAKKSWTDPYIGLRAQQPLGERWTLDSYLDIGGFGVASEFTWQAALGVNYDFSKSIAGKAGYRMMGVDYDNDGFAYDMMFSGVYLGLGIRF